MAEFLGSTGAKIVINEAPTEDAIALKCAIHAKINIPALELKAFKGGTAQIMNEMDIKPFFDALLAIDSDAEVNKCIMKCLERCTYNLQKITYRTFDDVRVREDYYKIIIECIKVNILPFYKGLHSVWNDIIKMMQGASLPQS